SELRESRLLSPQGALRALSYDPRMKSSTPDPPCFDSAWAHILQYWNDRWPSRRSRSDTAAKMGWMQPKSSLVYPDSAGHIRLKTSRFFILQTLALTMNDLSQEIVPSTSTYTFTSRGFVFPVLH
ncbi:hypothetical protein PMAYCL1PPCAC_22557, partial [Pristionchus mayeri]